MQTTAVKPFISRANPQVLQARGSLGERLTPLTVSPKIGHFSCAAANSARQTKNFHTGETKNARQNRPGRRALVNVIIRDLDQTRRHFENAVRLVGEQEATKAFNRALNSEGDKVRTLVRRSLRQQTGAKQDLINRQTKSFRSSFSSLTYTIQAQGDHVGLSHFNPRQFSYGVRAKPWGRSQRFEKAFLITSLHDNVFVREGKSRFPIRKMFGPSIPKEIMRDATRDGFEAAQPNVLAEARRQLQRMIEGGR